MLNFTCFKILAYINEAKRLRFAVKISLLCLDIHTILWYNTMAIKITYMITLHCEELGHYIFTVIWYSLRQNIENPLRLLSRGI